MADTQGAPQDAGTGDSRPVRIPLVTSLQNRSESPGIDGRLVNCHAEVDNRDKSGWIYKRPGTRLFLQHPAGAGLGVYNWNDVIYAVCGGTFYANSTAVGTVDAGSMYSFTPVLGATPLLFLHNGAAAYTYTPSTNALAAVSVPTPVLPGLAYLDSTIYVGNPPNIIQGSGLNDATTWDTLNTILAQIEPDQIVALGKQLVYVIAFKQWSTEMFYDAGNAAGSPLGAVQGQKMNFGAASAGTVASVAGALLWVTQIREGGRGVMLMDQASPMPVSTPQVDRLLQNAELADNTWAFCMKIDGHMFYVLNCQGIGVSLVYDLTQKLWYEWTYQGGILPFVSSTFQGGSTLLQHASNGGIYMTDATLGADLVSEGLSTGTPVVADIYTPVFDGGTRKRKMISQLRFIGDRNPGNQLKVRTSDDDYRTWSNFRHVDMGLADPRLDSNGTFRRRAWHIRQETVYGGRILEAMEPLIDLGDL